MPTRVPARLRFLRRNTRRCAACGKFARRDHACIKPGMSDDLKRFYAKVDKSGPNDCWPWKAGRAGKGYGQFYFNGRKGYAHRFSYIAHHGPLPRGALALHTCDNPICVNPAHLEAGSNKKNLRDMVARGRRTAWPEGRKWGPSNQAPRPNQKLTREQVVDIKREHAAGVKQKTLAAKHGVDDTTISHIIAGRIWKGVEA